MITYIITGTMIITGVFCLGFMAGGMRRERREDNAQAAEYERQLAAPRHAKGTQPRAGAVAPSPVPDPRPAHTEPTALPRPGYLAGWYLEAPPGPARRPHSHRAPAAVTAATIGPTIHPDDPPAALAVSFRGVATTGEMRTLTDQFIAGLEQRGAAIRKELTT